MTLHAAGSVHVVGESFRQDALERVAAIATGATPFLEELKGRTRSAALNDPKRRWFQAALVREPDNPHDANPIAVHAAGVGRVGYLDRETAIQYRPVFEGLARKGVHVGACPAKLTGLSSPEAVIGDLRASAGG